MKPKKILIVDDDTFLLDMYAMKFYKSKFEVLTALGPKLALDKLHDGFSPDVILLDIMMPVMDGFELLERIKRDNLAPNSTFIFLSNMGKPFDIERSKELGAAGYIIKASSTPSEVVDNVNNIINNKEKSN